MSSGNKEALNIGAYNYLLIGIQGEYVLVVFCSSELNQDVSCFEAVLLLILWCKLIIMRGCMNVIIL